MNFIEKIKNNQVIKTLKKLLSNKRYRGIIILFFWFIFFLFVILILRTTEKYNRNVEPQYTALEVLEKIKNYSVNYEIKKDDLIYNIDGNFINNETILNIDDKKYFIKDKIYLIENEVLNEVQNDFELEVWDININNLSNLLKDKEILYKTTKDDIKSTIYRLTMKEFSSLFETQIDSDEYIEINIQTKNNKYDLIYIDLTKYMNYNELKYKNYSITISLNSINEITQSSYNELIEGE